MSADRSNETIDNKRYIQIKRIGQGAYGDVHLAIDRQLGVKVAIKEIKLMNKSVISKAIFREIESLKQLSDNDNIIKLLGIYPQDNMVCLVFEYMPSDLSEIISSNHSNYLPTGRIKFYCQSMLSAVSYCHSNNIIHRDIKPSNFLISTNGELKLGDFGLARVYESDSPDSLSHQVSTRWYRAPELLFASRNYDLSIDIWSLGAVIAELYSLSPLFPGNNDIDQMFRVFQVMGSPSEDVWPGVQQLPDYCKISFPGMIPQSLRILIPRLTVDDEIFLNKMLQLCPLNRRSALELLSDEYFTHRPLPYQESSSYTPIKEEVK